LAASRRSLLRALAETPESGQWPPGHLEKSDRVAGRQKIGPVGAVSFNPPSLKLYVTSVAWSQFLSQILINTIPA